MLLSTIGRRVKRTWPIFLAYGTTLTEPQRFAQFDDGKKSPVVVFDWDPKHLGEYYDQTLPSVTGNEVIPYTVYVDKHPQPTRKAVLQDELKKAYGSITAEWMTTVLPKVTQSGDVHLLVYDWNERTVYIGLGVTNDSYTYEKDGQAWERPVLKFSIDKLLDERY